MNDSIKIFIDGACQPNPGNGGIGIFVSRGINEEKLNKELLKIVDELYGKPYEENSVKKCDDFVYKTIANSKDEILKIVNSGIY